MYHSIFLEKAAQTGSSDSERSRAHLEGDGAFRREAVNFEQPRTPYRERQNKEPERDDQSESINERTVEE